MACLSPLLQRLALVVLPALASFAMLAACQPQAQGGAQPQAFDATRRVLFLANTPDGAVHVLNLRNTIGELGVLRATQRRVVRDIRLDDSRHRLWVLGDDAAYCYDADTLRLIERSVLADAAGQRFARVEADSFTLEAAHAGRKS